MGALRTDAGHGVELRAAECPGVVDRLADAVLELADPVRQAGDAALAACPFVVVSDVIENTDTGAFAHVRLPAAAWGEQAGTVPNSHRTISRQPERPDERRVGKGCVSTCRSRVAPQ